MLFGKDRGPIYSRYDIDRPGCVNPVIDYAAPGRSRDDIEFITAHKITPTLAEPGDVRPGTAYSGIGHTASLRSLMKSSQSQANQTGGRFAPSAGTANMRRQSRAVLAAVILWILFILLSMLLSMIR